MFGHQNLFQPFILTSMTPEEDGFTFHPHFDMIGEEEGNAPISPSHQGL